MLLGFGAIQWSAKGISNGEHRRDLRDRRRSEVLVFSFAQTLLGKRSEIWLLVIGAAVTTCGGWPWRRTRASTSYVVIALLQGPAGTTLIAGGILYIARRFPTHLVATANGVNAVLVGDFRGRSDVRRRLSVGSDRRRSRICRWRR